MFVADMTQHTKILMQTKTSKKPPELLVDFNGGWHEGLYPCSVDETLVYQSTTAVSVCAISCTSSFVIHNNLALSVAYSFAHKPNQ